MSEKEQSLGLSCPRCGGMVPVPEGQAIVRCPYCELSSMVRGERGLRRYQVPQRIDRTRAAQALQGFFSGHRAIAADVARRASLQETFLVYLPFWASWARVLGWVFGQKRERQGEHTVYKPREIKFSQDVNWNGAACDVAEFGVNAIALTDQPLEAFDPEALHAAGMVFEPVGSASEAMATAENEFSARVHKNAGLDRVGQVFIRFIRQRFGLVYYPLWVLRYNYRQRAFQVLVDGHSGQVLYGKAPGNTLYRAAVLIGGMALGAFLAVDGSALAFGAGLNASGDDGSGFLIAGLVALAAGFGLMAAAYRSFRYGEQFEYRHNTPGAALGTFSPGEIVKSIEDLDKWISRLS